MRLLFDENLSRRLVDLLATEYPVPRMSQKRDLNLYFRSEVLKEAEMLNIP